MVRYSQSAYMYVQIYKQDFMVEPSFGVCYLDCTKCFKSFFLKTLLKSLCTF